jgi:polar amino acid transport system substrate-binding protein
MQRLRIPIIFLFLSLCFQVSALAKTIIVGGDRDYPPYEFLDSNGKPTGYNVELTRAIAEVMGLQVEFRLGGWSEQLRDLKEGRIDLLQGFSWSEQRAAQIDFIPPHTVVNHAIFARREYPVVSSLAELKGKKVTLHRVGIMHEQLLRQGYGPDLVPTSTPADALRLLASGQCDYARPVRRYPCQMAGSAGAGRTRAGQGDQTGCPGDYTAVAGTGGGMAFWSRSLHQQVALRTAHLTREIAERTAAEHELRRNQQQFVQADKMAALGVLVSGDAHEINNPNSEPLQIFSENGARLQSKLKSTT